MSLQRSSAHGRSARQCGYRVSRAEIRSHVLQDRAEPAAFVRRHRSRQILGLAAVAMCRDHESLSDVVCDRRAEIAPHQVQEHVESCGRARTRQNLAFVHIERIRNDSDARESRGQLVDVPPVGRGAPAVEDAGFSEDEYARTDRAYACSAQVRIAQLPEEHRRRPLIGVAPARNDDCVGIIDEAEALFRAHSDTAGGSDLSFFQGTDVEAVPRYVEFGSVKGKELGRAAELERTQSIVYDCDDAMSGFGQHVAILPVIVVCVTCLDSRGSAFSSADTIEEPVMSSRVTAVPAAEPARAQAHFESHLEFETDCWDVHEALSGGAADFVLLDVRGADAYRRGHIAGAVSLPHSHITDDALADTPAGRLFVTYCAGPHCNGAHRAAIRLARLGRPVKVMIGGVTGWLDEGFNLVS